MESFCVKQNNSPVTSLSFDMSYVGSRVVGSYLFTTVTSFLLDTLLGILTGPNNNQLMWEEEEEAEAEGGADARRWKEAEVAHVLLRAVVVVRSCCRCRRHRPGRRRRRIRILRQRPRGGEGWRGNCGCTPPISLPPPTMTTTTMTTAM
jgi:hypothetical protein